MYLTCSLSLYLWEPSILIRVELELKGKIEISSGLNLKFLGSVGVKVKSFGANFKTKTWI